MFWLNRMSPSIFLGAVLLLCCSAANTAASAAAEEEAALFAELDALLRDPLEDVEPPAVDRPPGVPPRVWQTTASTGLRLGYTTNALLSEDALAMPYVTATMDTSIMSMSERGSLIFMVSGENRRFLGDSAPDDERLALLLTRVETEAPLVDLGAETGTLHAKQAFDAAVSPLPQTPEAGFVTQTLPFARMWVRHYPFPRTALEWSIRADRAFFGDSVDDYTSGMARLRLSYSLMPGVLFHLAGERLETRYDKREPRLANGLPVADARLRLDTWRGEAELEVRSRGRFPVRAGLRAFVEERDDGMRGYYARTSRGLDGRASVRWQGWRGSMHGRYEDSPFPARLVSFAAGETVTQRRRSGALSVERTLGRWRIGGMVQRTRFLSNAEFETYTVNQYELSAIFNF